MAPAGKIINIKVTPEFFQRKPVQIASTILLLLLLVFIIKYLATKRLTLELAALQTQNELDQMRNTISRDIHDELGANITRITLATELLKRQDKNSNEFIEQLKKLGTLSKNLGKSLGEIVWSVNPQQNKSEYLILFIKQYLNEIKEDCELNISFNHIEIGKNITITPKAQRNIFLVIKEAVNNALKYANAKQIIVSFVLNTEEGSISIEINDNGQGFNLNELRPYSNGITNMKSRCSELNLHYHIDSELNKGTTVSITGDLSKIEQSFY
jgi:signal transduction histidine kinase